ncbi:DUF6644 family protein [Massilia sp. TN1-12]|uniref:DUF6644 family protein n=1 Tax=Massilia paldalensis TaxID=3377675 RepID=UPI003851035F
MEPLAQAPTRLAASPLAEGLRGDAWLYPLVETVHILGFVLLVGAVLVFDLRVLGFGAALPLRALARHTLPWSLASLLLVVPSGLLLFATQAPDLLANRAFLLKLGLLATAGLNALAFHLGPWRTAPDSGPAPLRARLQAGVSILLWIAVIACGRLLAYV